MMEERDKDIKAVVEALEQFIGRQRDYITALKDCEYESLLKWPLEMSRFQIIFERLMSELGQKKMAFADRKQLELLIALAVSQADEIVLLSKRRHQELTVSLPRLRRGISALRGYGNLAFQRPAEFLSSSG